MNIFQKIFSRQPKIEASEKTYEFGSYDNYNISSAKKREFLSSMTGWVFSAVSAIADEVASINLKLYQQNDDGTTEEVLDHKILDVLYKVNSYTTKFDHLWLTQASLELTGEAPWLIERDVFGEPESIYLLRPDMITPIADRDKLISGYSYRTDMSGRVVTLGTKDIMFLKYPSPLNQFRGSGTLAAAARTVDIDDEAEKWNLKFFENSARPDAVLTIPGMSQMTEEQKDKLKKSLKEKYQGTDKAHNLMVLFGDMKLDKFGFNASEMDFLEQQKFSRDKILGIFRVPKAIVAQTDGVNFASAKAAQYTFSRFTINPKDERIIQQLNEFFIPLFKNSENLFLDFDNPVVDDEAEKINKYNSAITNGWMTRNEVRALENLEPIMGGDYIFLSTGIYPAGSVDEEMPLVSPNATSTLTTPVNTSETPINTEGNKGYVLKGNRPTKKITISDERFKCLRGRNSKNSEVKKIYNDINNIESAVKNIVKTKVINQIKKNKLVNHKELVRKVVNDVSDRITRKQLSDEDKANFWIVKNFFYGKYVDKLKEIQIDIFNKQRKEVFDNLNSQKSFDLSKDKESPYSVKLLDKSKVYLDVNTQKKLAIELYMPTLKKLFKDSGDATFKLIDVNMSMDVDRKKITKLLEYGIRKVSKSATDTTNAKIESELAIGIGNDEGPADIAQRINNIFDDAIGTRADVIATTETARYNTNASEQAFADSGVVVSKEWIAEPDACDECSSLNGVQMAIGTVFLEKGEEINDVAFDYMDTQNPPLHPNCKCDIIPVFE